MAYGLIRFDEKDIKSAPKGSDQAILVDNADLLDGIPKVKRFRIPGVSMTTAEMNALSVSLGLADEDYIFFNSDEKSWMKWDGTGWIELDQELIKILNLNEHLEATIPLATNKDRTTPTAVVVLQRPIKEQTFNIQGMPIGQLENGFNLGSKKVPISNCFYNLGRSGTGAFTPTMISSKTFADGIFCNSADGEIVYGAATSAVANTDFFVYKRLTGSFGTATLTAKIKGMCCSADGRIVYVCTWDGKLYANYYWGVLNNWVLLYTETDADAIDFHNICCSTDGRCVGVVRKVDDATNNIILISDDFGATWNGTLTWDTIGASLKYDICCSADGKYFYACIANYGSGNTFVWKVTVDNTITRVSKIITNTVGYTEGSICCSADGSVVLFSGDEAHISLDYAVTFTQLDTGISGVDCFLSYDGYYAYIITSTGNLITVNCIHGTITTISGGEDLASPIHIGGTADGRRLLFTDVGTGQIFYHDALFTIDGATTGLELKMVNAPNAPMDDLMLKFYVDATGRVWMKNSAGTATELVRNIQATTAVREAMSLGAGDGGFKVFDTDCLRTFEWNGTEWVDYLSLTQAF